MDLHLLPSDHDDLGHDRPSWPPASEEASNHPHAGRIWERLIRAHKRRGLAYNAEALAVAALTIEDAPRDPLTSPRWCIYMRNGRLCPGNHANDCDIPW